jgi:hypothetical protein
MIPGSKAFEKNADPLPDNGEPSLWLFYKKLVYISK